MFKFIVVLMMAVCAAVAKPGVGVVAPVAAPLGYLGFGAAYTGLASPYTAAAYTAGLASPYTAAYTAGIASPYTAAYTAGYPYASGFTTPYASAYTAAGYAASPYAYSAYSSPLLYR